VREFLHNISNGLLPFTVELQMLREALRGLPVDVPEDGSFDETVEILTRRIDKWYKAYGSGILTLHRYFVFDGLEKANRLAAMSAIETLAKAAATGSTIPLEEAKQHLEMHGYYQNHAAPLKRQRDELKILLENIASWHENFSKRTQKNPFVTSQAKLLIERTQQATSLLSKLARLVPTGSKGPLSESRASTFYLSLGKFKVMTIKMAKKFEGWDSRRETHMELPY